MSVRRIAGYVISFLLGGVVTLLSLYVIAQIDLRSSRTIPLCLGIGNWKYKYGDLIITGGKIPPEKRPDTFDASQALSMSEGTACLVTVFQNEKGQTTVVAFSRDGHGIFDWQKTPEKPISERTQYGGDAGEIYYDLDLDGQYDLKINVEKISGEKRSYIYIQKDWKEVEKADFINGLARSDSDGYKFEKGKGWIEINREKIFDIIDY